MKKSNQTIEITSNWKAMIIGFIWKFIFATLAGFFIGSFLVRKLIGETFSSKSEANLAMLLIGGSVLVAWIGVFLIYFPKKWQQAVTIDLEEEYISIQQSNNTQRYDFAEITHVRYEALNGLLGYKSLFFMETKDRSKEFPLCCISDKELSDTVFFTLEKHRNIIVLQ